MAGSSSLVIRSLKELGNFSSKLPVNASSLLLSRSEDLVCNNLFCEKVTKPCICRLERALGRLSVEHLKKVDLSGNRLIELPPGLINFSE